MPLTSTAARQLARTVLSAIGDTLDRATAGAQQDTAEAGDFERLADVLRGCAFELRALLGE
jgi:hypothetical protein